MFKKLIPTCLTLLLMLSMTTVLSVKADPAVTYISVINATAGYGVPGSYGTTNFNFTDSHPPPTQTGYPLGYMIANITVTDVTNLGAWQLNLTWDPALLEIAVAADIYRPTGSIFGATAIQGSKQLGDGKVYWVVSRGMGEPTFDGSGLLCQIKFNITQEPSSTLSCDLTLDQASTFPTKITNSGGFPITYTPEHGYYQYGQPPPPPPPSLGAEFFVRPSEIINSSILPPQTISINITLKNVTDMYSYGFFLGYDSDILVCIAFAMFDVLNETNYIPEFSVDNTAGIIRVNVTYYPPAVPITTVEEVALVNILFRVKGIGATLLDLYDTSLLDSIGRPIPHTVHDGFFANLIRDLVLVNVAPNRTWAYQGNLVKVNVTVRNDGEMIETSVIVEVYFDGDLIDDYTIPSLDLSEEITTTIIWNTAAVTPCQNYTISAKVLPVPFEINTENNEKTDGKVKIRLPCDINGDKVVDVSDLVLVVNAAPSYPGSPNWNEYADVDDDGIVDVSDLARVIAKLGTSCL